MENGYGFFAAGGQINEFSQFKVDLNMFVNVSPLCCFSVELRRPLPHAKLSGTKVDDYHMPNSVVLT